VSVPSDSPPLPDRLSASAGADFDQVMREQIAPHLAAVEADRKHVLRYCLLSSAGLLALGVLAAWLFSISGFGPGASLAVFASVALIFALWKSQFDRFRIDFKQRLVAPLVHAFDPRLDYWPTDAITREEFEASRLFREHPVNRFRGEDLIQGTLGATAMKCSEVDARYRSIVKRRNQNDIEIFKGLFFIADFNKHFRGSIYVLPDRAQRSLGALGQALQSLSSTYGQLVKLEDPEFERLFVVYGSDQIETRYILSAALMARISTFRMKTRHDLRLAFVRSKLYMAIHTRRNLFEPRLLRNVADPALYREIWDDIELLSGIVDDLNLNTRIWSKR
jgi:hypothetical protein